LDLRPSRFAVAAGGSEVSARERSNKNATRSVSLAIHRFVRDVLAQHVQVVAEVQPVGDVASVAASLAESVRRRNAVGSILSR
ncbi:MAG: hypothetical protein KGP08_02360, partial [Xanthomonadaceae bacterium]|nr:hypothetical protein [Xanthomonadaceae bacterium]